MPDTIRGLELTSNIETETESRYVHPGVILKEARRGPIFAILQAIRDSETVTNSKVEWFVIETAPRVDVCTAGATDSATTITPDNIAYYLSDDYVWDVDTGEVFGPIISVDAGAGTFDIATGGRGESGTSAAVIGAGDRFVILRGKVKEGGDAAESLATKPVPDFNYVELISNSIKVSRRLENTKLYTGSERRTQRRLRWHEHNEDNERSLLYGRRGLNTADGNRWMMGGIEPKITTNVETVDVGAGAKTFDEDDLLNWFEKMSVYGQFKLTVFASGQFIRKIDSFGNNKLQTRPADKMIGMDINMYQSSFGVIDIIHHRLLTADYGEDWSALAIDLKDLSLGYITRTRLNTDMQNKYQKFIWDEYETEFTNKMGSEVFHGKFEVINS